MVLPFVVSMCFLCLVFFTMNFDTDGAHRQEATRRLTEIEDVFIRVESALRLSNKASGHSDL